MDYKNKNYQKEYYQKNKKKKYQQTKKWHLKHPEKAKEYHKKFRLKHPEKVKEYAHNWYINNKEKDYQNHLRWKKNNPDKIKEYNLKQYGLTLKDSERILIKQKRKCAICLCDLNNKFCHDHNHKTNTFRGILCADCNKVLGFSKEIFTH